MRRWGDHPSPITHHPSLITHHSSLITHHSSHSADVLEAFNEMIDSKRSLVLEDFKRVSHDDLEAEAKG